MGGWLKGGSVNIASLIAVSVGSLAAIIAAFITARNSTRKIWIEEGRRRAEIDQLLEDQRDQPKRRRPRPVDPDDGSD